MLEVGAGSGYAAAILAELAKEVVTIERHAALADKAREALQRLGYSQCHRDRRRRLARRWPERAPYDAILVAAGAPAPPASLKEQLAEGGRLVIPVSVNSHQDLKVITRRGDAFEEEKSRRRALRPAAWRGGVDCVAACPTKHLFEVSASLGHTLPTDRARRVRVKPRMAAASLPWGPLGERTLHLCVDMQNMFAEETSWHTPWMRRVLPVVVALVEAHPDRTIFTRFMPPNDPAEMGGSWRRYFERWREMTRSDRSAPARSGRSAQPLRSAGDRARQAFYSPFHGTTLAQNLRARGCDALVISGAETDMCVLASVLDAVDLGIRVVLATDAICSSSDEMHEALIGLYQNRFSQQVETADAETILGNWHR